VGAAVDHFNSRGISGAVKMLLNHCKNEAARGPCTDSQLDDLLSHLSGMLYAADLAAVQPRELADISWALGRLQVNNNSVVGDMMRKIGEFTQYRAVDFTPYDMANTVWGFASMSIRHEGMMSVIAAEVVSKIQRFDQRQLSNTAWAFATCGLWNEELVNAVAAESLAKIESSGGESRGGYDMVGHPHARRDEYNLGVEHQ
jgi:hypothetical protein